MRTMSIAQFAEAFDKTKTPLARAVLYFQSLGLRYKLWRIGRIMERNLRRKYQQRRDRI